jgi:hypothetical protein
MLRTAGFLARSEFALKKKFTQARVMDLRGAFSSDKKLTGKILV